MVGRFRYNNIDSWISVLTSPQQTATHSANSNESDAKEGRFSREGGEHRSGKRERWQWEYVADQKANSLHRNNQNWSLRKLTGMTGIKDWALVNTADQAAIFSFFSSSFHKLFTNSCSRLSFIFRSIEMASAVTDYCRTLVSIGFVNKCCFESELCVICCKFFCYRELMGGSFV